MITDSIKDTSHKKQIKVGVNYGLADHQVQAIGSYLQYTMQLPRQ